MRVGCLDRMPCESCPMWHVDKKFRIDAGTIIKELVDDGYLEEGENLSVVTIADLAIGEARENGDPSDAGIIIGALALIAAGKCDKVR